MSSRSTLRVSAATASLLACLLIAVAAYGQGEVASVPPGSPNRATMRTPTGMLYYVGVIDIQPDGPPTAENYPIVSRVDSGSVSARAGLRIGDVLLAVNGKDGREAQLFRLEKGAERWVMRIRRGTEEMELTMEVPASMRRGRAPSAAPR
jgi:membrane-associated protease RseP (regulator of RpoE activity)